MLKCRLYQPETDYPLFAGWWQAHNWPAVPAAILPPLGVVTENDGKPVACVWAYKDNSCGVAMIEWTVANPANPPRISYKAIQNSLSAVMYILKKEGRTCILGATNNPGLSRIFNKIGFVASDKNITHFVYKEK